MLRRKLNSQEMGFRCLLGVSWSLERPESCKAANDPGAVGYWGDSEIWLFFF